MATIDYMPDGPVLSKYLKSDAFMRVIVGPFGSGKTVASCVEIFRRAYEQKPGPDKVRRSRWLVVRNAYPRLTTTTIPTVPTIPTMFCSHILTRRSDGSGG